MGIINVKFYHNRIKWDLGLAVTQPDMGSKGTITKLGIIEMIRLKDVHGGGVEIMLHRRSFQPLKAMQGVLSVWDYITDINNPIEHSPANDDELYELFDSLYDKMI